MMALSRHRLHHLVRKGSKSAKLTAKLLAQTDKLLGSVLLGNTLLNVLAAALTQIIILRLFGYSEWAIVTGTLLITFVILVPVRRLRNRQPRVRSADTCARFAGVFQ